MAPHAPQKAALLAAPLAKATALVVLFPRLTLALALLSGLAALWYAGTGLGFKTARQDLVAPDAPNQAFWQAYVDEFGEDDDAVVVVEGPNPEAVERAIEEIVDRLEQQGELFHSLLHRIDLSRLRAKGLHYLPPNELVTLDRFLLEVAPIVGGDWSRLRLANQFAALEARLLSENQQGQLRSTTDAELLRLTQTLLAAARGERPAQDAGSPWPAALAALDGLSTQTLSFEQGRLGLLLLRLAISPADGFARGGQAISVLRHVLDQVQAQRSDVRIGLTGLPVMEYDEMVSSQRSTIWASVLSFVGVVLLVIAGFGGLRHAALVNLVLLVGMAWSFGYATYSVGHLNILSVTFTVTLIGIGVDYGIHFVAHYLHLRETGQAPAPALVDTGRTLSPAIVTGAVTTAVAFLAAGCMSFVGIAELGLIAGGGILLCALAELLVLPAAIVLVDRSRLGPGLPRMLPMHRWFAPLARFPVRVMCLGMLLCAASAGGLRWLYYDHNLQNLQAETQASLVLEQRLSRQHGQSLWFALSLADTRAQLLARKAAFERLASVERTEEIVTLLPAEDAARAPLVEQIAARLRGLPEQVPLVPLDAPAAVAAAAARCRQALAQRPLAEQLAPPLLELHELLAHLPTGDWYRLASAMQQQMAGELLSRLQSLAAVANPAPPSTGDLPGALVERFYGRTGRHLLRVFGRGDVWDMDTLSRFVKQVRGVDPAATGNPLQAHDASLDMQRGYERAAWLAAAAILALLIFDFRSVSLALLAASPLVLGLVQAFGLLGWWGCPLNPANLIALPILLGIGVDYGVHLVHDFRQQSGPYRLSPSTTVAVVIDSLTTMVGFGALMIADHRGLVSLGRVLVLGVACCLWTSLLLLPAALSLFSRRRSTLPLLTAGQIPAESLPASTLSEGPHQGPPRPHGDLAAYSPVATSGTVTLASPTAPSPDHQPSSPAPAAPPAADATGARIVPRRASR